MSASPRLTARPSPGAFAHSSTSRLVYLSLLIALAVFAAPLAATAQQRRTSSGARVAVVVDERLSALRDAPDLSANLLQRMSRGRTLTVTGARRAADGVTFYRVMVTRRTGGWVQAEAVVSPARAADAERLLRLIRGSEEFDRLERAGLFLEMFPRSPLRPAVLLLHGDAADAAAARLTREAARRLDAREMEAGGAPRFTYFLNYNGLDRYRRLGVAFTFDRAATRFRYDGASWREILRRHPHTPEAAESRNRLQTLSPKD